MSKKKVGKIMIELDGVPTDITKLDKADYEQFLDFMHKLRLLYISIKDRPDTKNLIKENTESNIKN